MTTEEAAVERSARYLKIYEILQRFVVKGYIDKDTFENKDKELAEEYQVERGTGIPLSIRGSRWANKEIDDRYFTYSNIMDTVKRWNPTGSSLSIDCRLLKR